MQANATCVLSDLKRKPVSPVLIAGVVALAALAINGVIPTVELIQADLGTLDGGLPKIVGALTAGYALGQLVLSVIVDGRDK